jgi:hypothetical protein
MHFDHLLKDVILLSLFIAYLTSPIVTQTKLIGTDVEGSGRGLL